MDKVLLGASFALAIVADGIPSSAEAEAIAWCALNEPVPASSCGGVEGWEACGSMCFNPKTQCCCCEQQGQRQCWQKDNSQHQSCYYVCDPTGH